jgi:hypothetical protein
MVLHTPEVFTMQIQTQTHVRLIQAEFTEAWFETLFKALDRLHDAASGEQSPELAIAPAEMMGWLDDIIYTAQETMAELRARNTTEAEPLVG